MPKVLSVKDISKLKLLDSLEVDSPTFTKSDVMHIGLGGLLHDLGKVKIPTEILNNPGKLSEEEYNQIKQHPTFGIDLLLSGHCDTPQDLDLQVIARVIHEHHENWNGTGYPHKLKGEDISYFARVCTIADFFDAITTKRSYNEVLALEHAVGVMEKTAGVKIDPNIFEVFTSKVKKIVLKQKVDVRLADSFDPTLPYEKLPLEKVKIEDEKQDFGKIKIQGDLGLKKNKKSA
jgi:HD-GYP domain-containing protein (c-di-GMP phosphodiesterase class II)